MKKIFCAMLLLTLPLFLSGCWDYMPLDQAFTVTGIGIDIDKDFPDQILVTFCGAGQSTSKFSTSGGEYPNNTTGTYSVIKSTGDSVLSAFSNAKNTTNLNLAINNVKVIVFSEEIARKGINKYLDSFIRNAQVGPNAIMIVTKGSAQELLSFNSSDVFKIPKHIIDAVNSSDFSVKPSTFTLKQVTYALSSDYKGFVLPYFTLDTSEKEIKYDQFSLFKEDQMVALLPESELIAYSILGDLLKGDEFSLDSHHTGGITTDGSTFRISQKSRKVRVSLTNDQVTFDIQVKIKATVREMILGPKRMNSESQNLQNDSDAIKKQYEQEIATVINQNMSRVLKKMQKDYAVDPLAFGEYVRVKFPETFKSIPWEELFPVVHFNVDTTVNIDRWGVIKLE